MMQGTGVQIKHVSAGQSNNRWGLIAACLYFFAAANSLYVVKNIEIIGLIISIAEIVLDISMVALVLATGVTSRQLLIASPLMFVALLIAYKSGSLIFAKAILLIILFSNDRSRQIPNYAPFGIAAAFAFGVASMAFGVDSPEVFRRGGIAFGFDHPNQASLYAAIAIMMSMVLDTHGRKRHGLINLVFIIAIFMTGSKTALLAVVLTAVLTFLFDHLDIVKCSRVATFVSLLPIGLFVFTVLSAAYIYDYPILKTLNDVFTGRIWLNWFALNSFEITLFGQQVNLNVPAVYNSLTDLGNITTTVDCGYVASLLVYGVSGTLMVLAAMILAIRSSFKRGNSGLCAAAIVLSLYAFTESVVVSPLIYFPMLFIANADCTRRDGILDVEENT